MALRLLDNEIKFFGTGSMLRSENKEYRADLLTLNLAVSNCMIAITNAVNSYDKMATAIAQYNGVYKNFIDSYSQNLTDTADKFAEAAITCKKDLEEADTMIFRYQELVNSHKEINDACINVKKSWLQNNIATFSREYCEIIDCAGDAFLNRANIVAEAEKYGKGGESND